MLKKKINVIVNNIIEECYSVQMYNQGKLDKETNKIVDEAVDMFDDLLARVQTGKTIKDRKDQKKHYELINTDLEKASLSLMGKLNKIG